MAGQFLDDDLDAYIERLLRTLDTVRQIEVQRKLRRLFDRTDVYVSSRYAVYIIEDILLSSDEYLIRHLYLVDLDVIRDFPDRFDLKVYFFDGEHFARHFHRVRRKTDIADFLSVLVHRTYLGDKGPLIAADIIKIYRCDDGFHLGDLRFSSCYLDIVRRYADVARLASVLRLAPELDFDRLGFCDPALDYDIDSLRVRRDELCVSWHRSLESDRVCPSVQIPEIGRYPYVAGIYLAQIAPAALHRHDSCIVVYI